MSADMMQGLDFASEVPAGSACSWEGTGPLAPPTPRLPLQRSLLHVPFRPLPQAEPWPYPDLIKSHTEKLTVKTA